MRLKQIFQFLLFTLFSIITLSSCNEDSSTTTAEGASADAQIYSFRVAAIAQNAIDSANYPVMEKTIFAIDQFNERIYNIDSLPYKTALKKFAVTLAYATNGIGKLQLVYPDSISEWNGSDSIDFSLNPKINVIAANGTSHKEYTIDIRIHKIDPDTLIWHKIATQPNTVGQQKTLLKDNSFYTFSIDTDGKFRLYTVPKAESLTTWVKQDITSVTNIVLESITLFNNTFFAIDSNGQSYSSSDGIAWIPQSNKKVIAIFGTLPATTAKTSDSLLVAVNDGGTYFAKTVDMNTLVKAKNMNEDRKSVV
jgi:hypothetical protein